MTELWQGAQFMTEKSGGSDVGGITTTAVKSADGWRIHGEKWFCSNADADVATLLARPEGAQSGSRGTRSVRDAAVTCGRYANRYRIVRLKDKLGTRSMASGEINLEGALAYPLGHLDAGLKQMAEMINWSRLVERRQVGGIDAPRGARRVAGLPASAGIRLATARLAAGAAAVVEALVAQRTGFEHGFLHGRCARCLRSTGPRPRERRSRRAAARDAGVEDARHARRAPRYRRCDGNSWRLWLCRGLRRIRDCCATRTSVRSGKARRASSASTRCGARSAATVARVHIRRRCSTGSIGVPRCPSPFVEELRAHFATRSPSQRPRNEQDELWVRQAVTALYHASSAVLLAFEGCETARVGAAMRVACCGRDSRSTTGSIRAVR